MQNPLLKPQLGKPCNGCGYCCMTQPCAIASEHLNCSEGPCVALEKKSGAYSCGMVRNPIQYMYKAAHPGRTDAHEFCDVSDLSSEFGREIAVALGVGLGCDAIDDEESMAWNRKMSGSLENKS